MRHLTETEIRASFVNCSKGEAKRLGLPPGLEELPWDDLDFLGWRDPGARERAYLVTEHGGGLLGLSLRSAAAAVRGFTSRSMCSLCVTTHTGGGVALMTARRTGEAGRQGNTVGKYLCADLACSLYIRGKRQTAAGRGLDETLSLDGKIARARGNLRAFVDLVTE
ncbi:FBP domain-containing protein [Streptomyces fuscigenes]|uniref:FBP domain-containing protein n=1 Tax=Streptomyces fuscigenes TaxID=1528880 RepID=UPI001F3CA290|nr:FBP domain-containing protein [Streptomyces fuscigenes]MCF3964910.1 FBP domain-containing protein [Streptomyces fuscigenes]